MFKTNFSGHKKLWSAKKLGGPARECLAPSGLVVRTKVVFTLTTVKYIALQVQFACSVWLR